MPLENVKKRILEEAEESASRIKSEGTSEAGRILSEAEAAARQIEHQAREEADAEAGRLTAEHESAMEIEIKTMLAEAKGLQLERATEQVVLKAKALLEEKYMKKMLEEGISQFGRMRSGEPVIFTSKKNQKTVESLKKPTEVKYQEVEGFVLKAKDGSISINVSAETVLRDNIDEIGKIVSKKMYGDRETGSEESITEEEML